jgi:hypothetical protein
MEKRLAPGMVLGRRLRGCEVAGFILTEAYFPTDVGSFPPGRLAGLDGPVIAEKTGAGAALLMSLR